MIPPPLDDPRQLPVAHRATLRSHDALRHLPAPSIDHVAVNRRRLRLRADVGAVGLCVQRAARQPAAPVRAGAAPEHGRALAVRSARHGHAVGVREGDGRGVGRRWRRSGRCGAALHVRVRLRVTGQDHARGLRVTNRSHAVGIRDARRGRRARVDEEERGLSRRARWRTCARPGGHGETQDADAPPHAPT